MFKIGNRKELPTIPDYLSDEGKDFVRLCLQRDPKHRATASQLLEHPFVKSLSLYPQMLVSASSVHPAAPNAIKSEVLFYSSQIVSTFVDIPPFCIVEYNWK